MDAEMMRRADRAMHDVAQTHLGEFVGSVDLVGGDP
jgi:hypothetical protein